MMHNTGITAGVAETLALAVDGAQPVWLTLNHARERAFTGEIVFETDPEVRAYLDNGIVYYAERVSDASLGRRLLEAGVVDIEQLERGTVRVGDVEHLGRLFDRDPSVDRDAVTVLAETATEELVTELANRAIASVRVTAYRHHPSGVHRWFATKVEPAAAVRPASTAAHFDSTVIDGLPSLPYADSEADELIIEWDVELGSTELRADVFDLSLDFDELHEDPRAHDGADVEGDTDLYLDSVEDLYLETFDDVYLDTVDELHADSADLYVETADDLDSSAADAEIDDDAEFTVVWPDGTEESTVLVDADAEADVEAQASTEAPAIPADERSDIDETEPHGDTEPLLRRSSDGYLEFTMPPLELSDEPEVADAEVPDDVADAVRRAIAAIESAGAATSELAPPWETTGQLPQITGGDTLADAAAPVTTEARAAGFGGFAPPTMAMRAEVLYGQMDADGSLVADAGAAVHRAASPSETMPSVFAEDPADGDSGGDERSSALRRLIGSLRRKDH
jgi:hypothetical protein